MTPAVARAAVVTLRKRAIDWARSYGLDSAGAEDVAHDALEILLRRAEDVDADKAVAFLRQTVLNKAREAKRHRVDEPVEQATDAPNAEDTLVSAQLRREVSDAMERIESSRRAILRGVTGEGRPLAAVAREEGIPESVARHRLAYATDDFRAEMGRRKASERRRSGFTSWLAAWGLMDVRWRRWIPAFGAAITGGVLLTSEPPLLAQRAVTPVPIAPVALVEDAPPLDTREPLPVEAVRPVVRERSRHDAGRRFRAERFGQP